MIRRHRAIWQADSARDFSSRQGLKSAGIVCISSFSNYRIGGKDPAKREDAIVRCCRKKKERSLSQCCSDLEVASNGYLQIFYISVRISSTQKSLFTKKIFLYIIKMKIDLFFGCFNTSEQV